LRGPKGERLNSALSGRVTEKGNGTVEKVIIRNSDSTFVRTLYLTMYDQDTLFLPSGFTSISRESAYNELKPVRDSVKLLNAVKMPDKQFERISLNLFGMISKWTPYQLYLSCPVDFSFIYSNTVLNSVEKGYLMGGFIIGRFDYYASGKLDDAESWYCGIERIISVYKLLKLKIRPFEIPEIEDWTKAITSEKLLKDLRALKK
jgi:hypothetical protein